MITNGLNKTSYKKKNKNIKKILSLTIILLFLTSTILPAVNSLSVRSTNNTETEEQIEEQETSKDSQELNKDSAIELNKDSDTEPKNIIEKIRNTNKISNFIKNTADRIKSLVSRVRSSVKSLLDIILNRNKEDENTENLPTVETISVKQTSSSSSLYLHTNYNGIEKDTPLKLFRTIKIDVDNDPKKIKDISAKLSIYPSINKNLALVLNYKLVITRLTGFSDKNIFFEAYADYHFPGLLVKQLGNKRIRFGYQSPEDEIVPKTCTVTYQFLPHFFTKSSFEHKVSLNVGNIAGQNNLALIFSHADIQGEIVTSETSWNILYKPAVNSELNLGGLDDKFGKKFGLTCSDPSHVTITRTDNKGGKTNTFGVIIDKLTGFTCELELTPFAEGGGKIEYKRLSEKPVDVTIFIEHNTTTYIYGNGISDHILLFWDFNLRGNIELNSHDQRLEEVGFRNAISEEEATSMVYFSNLPSLVEVSWDLRIGENKTFNVWSDMRGTIAHVYTEDLLGTGLKLQIDVSPGEDLDFSMFYSKENGIFRVDRSISQVELVIFAEYTDYSFNFSGSISRINNKPFEILVEKPDEGTKDVSISCGKSFTITGLYLLVHTKDFGDYGVKAEQLVMRSEGSFDVFYSLTMEDNNFTCTGYIESTGGIKTAGLWININGNWYLMPDADTDTHWRYDFNIKGTVDVEVYIAEDFSWGRIIIKGSNILYINSSFVFKGRHGKVTGIVYFNSPDDKLEISWETINGEKVFTMDGSGILGLSDFHLWFEDVIELNIEELSGSLLIEDVSLKEGDIVFTIQGTDTSFNFDAKFSSKDIDDISVNVSFDIKFERKSSISFILSWENYNITSCGFQAGSNLEADISRVNILVEISDSMILFTGEKLMLQGICDLTFDICDDAASFSVSAFVSMDDWNIHLRSNATDKFILENLSLYLNGTISVYFPYDFINNTPYIDLTDTVLDLHIDNLDIPEIESEDIPQPFGEIALKLKTEGSVSLSILGITTQVDKQLTWIGPSLGIDATDGVLYLEKLLFEKFPFFETLYADNLVVTGRSRIDFILGLSTKHGTLYFVNISINNDPDTHVTLDRVGLSFGVIEELPDFPVEIYDGNFSEGISDIRIRLFEHIGVEIVEGLNIENFGLAITIPGSIVEYIVNIPDIPDPVEIRFYIDDPVEYLLLDFNNGVMQETSPGEKFIAIDTHNTTVTADLYIMVNKEFINYGINISNDLFGTNIEPVEYDFGIRFDNLRLKADGFILHNFDLVNLDIENMSIEGYLYIAGEGNIWLYVQGSWRPLDDLGNGTSIEISPGHIGFYVDHLVVLGQTFTINGQDIRIRGLFNANNCRVDIWWNKETGFFKIQADAGVIIRDFLFEVDGVIHVYIEDLEMEQEILLAYQPTFGDFTLKTAGSMYINGSCEFDILSNFITLDGSFDVTRSAENILDLYVRLDPISQQIQKLNLNLTRDASLTVSDFNLNFMGWSIEWEKYSMHTEGELGIELEKNDLAYDFDIVIDGSVAFILENFYFNLTSITFVDQNSCGDSIVKTIDLYWSVFKLKYLKIGLDVEAEGGFIGILSSAGVTGFVDIKFGMSSYIKIEGLEFRPCYSWFIYDYVNSFVIAEFEHWAGTYIELDFYIDSAKQEFELGYAKFDYSASGHLHGVGIIALGGALQFHLDEVEWQGEIHILYVTGGSTHYEGHPDGPLFTCEFAHLSRLSDSNGDGSSLSIKIGGSFQFSLGEVTNSGKFYLYSWPWRGYWQIEADSSHVINDLHIEYDSPHADLTTHVDRISLSGSGKIYMDLMDNLRKSGVGNQSEGFRGGVFPNYEDGGFLSSFKGVVRIDLLHDVSIQNIVTTLKLYNFIIIPPDGDNSDAIFVDGDVTVTVDHITMNGGSNFELGWANSFLNADFDAQHSESVSWHLTIDDRIRGSNIFWESTGDIQGDLSVAFSPGILQRLNDFNSTGNLNSGPVDIKSNTPGHIDCDFLCNNAPVFDVDLGISSGRATFIAKINNGLSIDAASNNGNGLSFNLNSLIVDFDIVEFKLEQLKINTGSTFHLDIKTDLSSKLNFNMNSDNQCSLKLTELGWDIRNYPELDDLKKELLGSDIVPDHGKLKLTGPNNGIIEKPAGQINFGCKLDPLSIGLSNTIPGFGMSFSYIGGIPFEDDITTFINNNIILWINEKLNRTIPNLEDLPDIEFIAELENLADEFIFDLDASGGTFYADSSEGVIFDRLGLKLRLLDNRLNIPGVALDIHKLNVDDISFKVTDSKTLLDGLVEIVQSAGKDARFTFYVYQGDDWKTAFDVQFDINLDGEGYWKYQRYENLDFDPLKSISTLLNIPQGNINMDIDLNIAPKIDAIWDFAGAEGQFHINTYGKSLVNGAFWLWRGDNQYSPDGIIGGIRFELGGGIVTGSNGYTISWDWSDLNNPLDLIPRITGTINKQKNFKLWIAWNGEWVQICGDKTLMVDIDVKAFGNVSEPIDITGRVLSGGKAPYDYSWDFDGDDQYDLEETINSDTHQTTYTYHYGGDYQIKLYVKDSNGIDGEDYAYISIDGASQKFSVNLAHEYKAPPNCFIKFTPTVEYGEGPFTFEWDFGDGYTLDPELGDEVIPEYIHEKYGKFLTKGTYKEPEHQYWTTGTFTVKVIVTDSKGRTVNDTATVDIFPGYWSISLKATYVNDLGETVDVHLYENSENKPKPELYKGQLYTYTVTINGETEFGWNVQIQFGDGSVEEKTTGQGDNKQVSFQHTFHPGSSTTESYVRIDVDETGGLHRSNYAVYPYKLKDFDITSVSGTVYDYNNQHINQPVKNAHVINPGNEYGHYAYEDYTDENGKYSVETHQFETTIKVEKTGYITHEEQLQIPSGSSQTLDIYLKHPVTIDLLWNGKKLYENTDFSVHVTKGIDGSNINGANVKYYWQGVLGVTWYVESTGTTNSDGLVTFTSREVDSTWRTIVPSLIEVNYDIDNDGSKETYYAQFNVYDGTNNPPSTPDKPYLKIGSETYTDSYNNGEVGYNYDFRTKAIDNDQGDKIEFGWDWDGDNTVDEWDDNDGKYYDSNTLYVFSHVWTQRGTYNVKVKARDTQMATSSWSSSFTIKVEKIVFNGIGLHYSTVLRGTDDGSISIGNSKDQWVKGYDLNVVNHINNYVADYEIVTADSYYEIKLKNGYTIKALSDQELLICAGRYFKPVYDIDIDDQLYGGYGIKLDIQEKNLVELNTPETFYKLFISGTHNVWMNTGSGNYVLAKCNEGSYNPPPPGHPGLHPNTLIKISDNIIKDMPVSSLDVKVGTDVIGYIDGSSGYNRMHTLEGKSIVENVGTCYTITTSSGHSITVGSGQNFSTPNGYKTAAALYPGDTVYVYDGKYEVYKTATISSKQEITGSSYYLLKVSHNHGCFANGFAVYCNDADANNPPVLSNPSPQHGATGVGLNAELSWSCYDAEGDPLTFDVYFGTDSIPDSGELVSEGQTETTYTLTSLNYDTDYYWKIIAYDNPGNTAEGPVWHFKTTSQSYPNDPPNTPNPPSYTGSNHIVGTSVEFTVSTTDPDGNRIKYIFDWDDYSTSETGYKQSGETVTVSHIWDDVGTYNVKVKARDEHGAESGWSSPVSIEMGHELPTAHFTMNDTTPEVGQLVLLDASGSRDNDENEFEITTYIWEKKWYRGLILGWTDWQEIPQSYNKVLLETTFNGDGPKQIRLTVTDDEDGTATYEKSITVTFPLD